MNPFEFDMSDACFFRGLCDVGGDGITEFFGGSRLATLYECGECKAITNTVWNWAGKQYCRRCFGLARGFGDMPEIQRDSSIRVVRADGRIEDMGAKPGKPAASEGTVPMGGAATRKIRLTKDGE